MIIAWLGVLTLLLLWLLWRSFTVGANHQALSEPRILQQDSADSTTQSESDSAQQLQLVRAELAELRAGVIGVGQRVLQLESELQNQQQQLSEQAEQLQALQLTEPESKLYSRAMKMVQLGADLEEIMRECELPRAEAELLFHLHQQKG
ncbi:DUF2802 domain-containing protein [Alkalimonas delamerensis]|uniref:DUF2802 domain-containing protein n=1 Tax=Alkalimonas delamerensis TaxID=265981 RepID=A0ABT9GMR6_9GAMM|nr:DUF2802 domain-containing protein [Alkalimonas delamerensis]MDP4528253.1 DUF2802 domain-containing protein [Alkalimonas delamerensis]